MQSAWKKIKNTYLYLILGLRRKEDNIKIYLKETGCEI